MQLLRTLILLATLLTCNSVFAQGAASLTPVRSPACAPSAESCNNFDAIVFVHGIYGDATTFVNPDTKFDWPRQMPPDFRDRKVDVFSLNYETRLFAWLQEAGPKFDELMLSVYAALKPLRQKNYRSIGFVAHSLGGNVVPAYITYVTLKSNHPGSSQHAYLITLATPVLGAQIADLGTEIKRVLGFSADPLLESLKNDNQLLRTLLEFRKAEGGKKELFGCRPMSLHAAYEQKHLGPFLVVSPGSAALSVAGLTSSPVVGFPLNHSAIAKPSNKQDEVYKWVNQRIEDEFVRLSAWEKAVALHAPSRRLCTDIDRKPEASQETPSK